MDNLKLRIIMLNLCNEHQQRIRKLLNESGAYYTADVADDAVKFIESPESETYDILLTDVESADNESLKALSDFMVRSEHSAVIVFMRKYDVDMMLKVIQLGAQDCININTLDAKGLLSRILMAIERQRIASLREFEKMSRHNEVPYSSISAKNYGSTLMSLMSEETKTALVNDYRQLIDKAMTRRMYQINDNLSEAIVEMADYIGFLRAGPRDLIEIHTEALKHHIKGAPTGKTQALIDESRFILLELMGDLVSFYRRYSVIPSAHIKSTWRSGDG